MSSFKLAFHSMTGRRIVEVWEGDAMVAAIYPDDETPGTIKIISKHLITAHDDRQPQESMNVIPATPLPGALVVTINMESPVALDPNDPRPIWEQGKKQ